MEKADLFILDDRNNYNIVEEEVEAIRSFLNILKDNYNLHIREITFDDMAERLAQDINDFVEKNNVDTIIALGNGGEYLYNSLACYFNKKIKKIKVKCRKKWLNNLNESYICLEKKQNYGLKNIVLDDVMVTGDSVIEMEKEISMQGGELLKVYIGVKSFKCCYNKLPVKCAFEVKSRKEKIRNSNDLFWYPPIYSIRHIINFENGLKDFPKVISEKYFEGDIYIEESLEMMGKIFNKYRK